MERKGASAGWRVDMREGRVMRRFAHRQLTGDRTELESKLTLADL